MPRLARAHPERRSRGTRRARHGVRRFGGDPRRRGAHARCRSRRSGSSRGSANGQLALDELKRTPVDVLVLDIEMPVMDGMTALPLLLRADPGLKVIMASTLTTRGADIALRALRARRGGLRAEALGRRPATRRSVASWWKR